MADFSQLSKLMDGYTLRARLFPAAIAAAPLMVAAALFLSWDRLSLSNMVSTAILIAILYALADEARRRGAALEKKIFQEMGGTPSTTMLRRTGDGPIDEATKDRYRNFIAGKREQIVPTAEEEAANQEIADKFYDQCALWLRTNTRDVKTFPIVFNELVSYGFRRNLLGVKWLAIGLDVIVAIVVAGSIWYRNNFDPSNDTNKLLILLFAITVVHAIYFLFIVSKESVKDAARKYARELILSCELLMVPKVPATKPRKKQP